MTSFPFPVEAPSPLTRAQHAQPKIALVAGGLGVYWGQFAQLLPTLRNSSKVISDRISAIGANVEDFGFVSNAVEGAAAAEKVRASNPDLIVLFVSTYMTSGQVLPIFKYGGAPILLLNLQPGTSMDHENFDTGDWLGYAGSAGLPEMGVALERLNLPIRSVSGHLEDERAWNRVAHYIRAIGVVSNLRRGRYGLLGHLYPGMFDIQSNITAGYSTFGGHVEILELDDLRRFYDDVSIEDEQSAFETVNEVFNILPGTDLQNIRFQVKVSVALDRLVEEYNLNTLAYFHMGNSNDIYSQLATAFPIGATLLSSRGIPTVTEFELRAGIAMYITGQLGGGGTFTEGQALDFDRGHVELGHNDAADASITSNRPVLRSLKVFHGKSGGGASVEATVRPGPVTQFSIGELHDGRLRFIASEGTAVTGPGIKIGNTTTRIDFGCDPADWTDAWAQSGSTHHWAMSVGHLANDIKAVANFLGAEYVRIQPS